MDIKELAKNFLPCQECALANNAETVNLPGTAQVAATLRDLFSLLFPGCHGTGPVPHEQCHEHVEKLFSKIAREIEAQILQVLRYQSREKGDGVSGDENVARAHAISEIFMAELPAISKMEMVMAYPGFRAIVVHRLAHTLYSLQVPILPRVMSEIAHSETGIDIHPGAQIGEHFFIDHGTGVVIGETTVIGKNVKLYQGVTLGALSFPKDESTGMLMKGHKRHPNVEDNVVIYAGATILGGETTIGHDSEIGGNVWLMESIPPFSRVYNQTPSPRIKQMKDGRVTRRA